MALSATAARHSHATRLGCLSILNNWIRPSWGMLDIHAVRIVEIEHWLGEQKRLDGSALANSSKAKIRSVFCVLFNPAIRNEWLEQGKNPALHVRQSAKRRRAPDILEPNKLRALLTQSETLFRSWCLWRVRQGYDAASCLLSSGRYRFLPFADRHSTVDLLRSHRELQNRSFPAARSG